jgi:hypothetical protein
MGKKECQGSEKGRPGSRGLRAVDQKERQSQSQSQKGKEKKAPKPRAQRERAVTTFRFPYLERKNPLKENEDVEKKHAADKGIGPKEGGQKPSPAEDGEPMKRSDQRGRKRWDFHGRRTRNASVFLGPSGRKPRSTEAFSQGRARAEINQAGGAVFPSWVRRIWGWANRKSTRGRPGERENLVLHPSGP